MTELIKYEYPPVNPHDEDWCKCGEQRRDLTHQGYGKDAHKFMKES